VSAQAYSSRGKRSGQRGFTRCRQSRVITLQVGGSSALQAGGWAMARKVNDVPAAGGGFTRPHQAERRPTTSSFPSA